MGLGVEWSGLARSAIGGGGQIGCQDRYRAWGFGQQDRWFDLEAAATTGVGGGWWVVDCRLVTCSSFKFWCSLSLRVVELSEAGNHF